MQIKVKCPNRDCDQMLVLDAAMAGRKGKCASCGKTFQIPKNLGASQGAGGGQSAAPKPAAKPTAQRSGQPSASECKPQQASRQAPAARQPQASAPRPAAAKAPAKQPSDDVIDAAELSKFLVDEEPEEQLDEVDFIDEEPAAPKPAARKPAERPKPARPAAKSKDIVEADVVEEPEDYDDYEDYEAEPRRATGGRATRARRDDYEELDELEEVDEPRGGRHNRDEFDDFEDERPRRRPRDDYDDEDEPDAFDDFASPRSRRGGGGMSQTKRWKLASAGFLIVAIATCVYAGSFAFTMLSELLAELAPVTKSLGMLRISENFYKIGSIVAFIAVVASVVGYVFCVFVPNKHGSLGLAIAALAVVALEMVMRLIFRMIPSFKASWRVYDRMFAAILGGAIGYDAGHKVLLFFLELITAAAIIVPAILMAMVAKSRKDRRHASDCMRIVWFGCGYGGAFLLLMIFVFVGSAEKWCYYTTRTINWAANGLWATMLIFFIINMFYTRKLTS